MEILPEVLKWQGYGGNSAVCCGRVPFVCFFFFFFGGGLGVIYYNETLNFLGASGCLFLVLLFKKLKLHYIYLLWMDV